MRLPTALGLLLLSSSVGCDDPARDTTPAVVTETDPASSSTPSAPVEEGGETLSFSNVGSSIEFVGSKPSGSHDGRFDRFTGTLTLNPADLTASRVELTIQMSSVVADADRLTGHLKTDDFFDVPNHPTATFRSASIRAGAEGDATHTITGELTIRGQTNTISFPATVAVTDGQVTTTAEFSIDRQLWGIAYAGMQDDLIRDGVVIKLSIAADRG